MTHCWVMLGSLQHTKQEAISVEMIRELLCQNHGDADQTSEPISWFWIFRVAEDPRTDSRRKPCTGRVWRWPLEFLPNPKTGISWAPTIHRCYVKSYEDRKNSNKEYLSSWRDRTCTQRKLHKNFIILNQSGVQALMPWVQEAEKTCELQGSIRPHSQEILGTH